MPFLYQRLTKSLLEEMASGIYRDGQRFLSLRQIERLWQVSEPTILTSLETLLHQRLLIREPRRGYFLPAGFQQKAQVLLRRNRIPALPFPLTLEQKARMLAGVTGGQVAILMETRHAPAPSAPETLPDIGGISPTVRRCGLAFEKEGRKYGFEPSWLLYDENQASAAWIAERLAKGGYQAAAVYCRSGHPIVRTMVEPLLARRLPVIMMYGDCQNLPVYSVNINNVALGYDAIRHLYRMGHRRVTILARPGSLKTHVERMEGARLACSEGSCHDMSLEILRLHHNSPPSAAVERFFADKERRPTAIFSLESILITPLLPIWQKHRISIPGDLSIMMCSSRKHLKGTPLPLDSMQLEVGRRIGKLSARLLHRIQSGEAVKRNVLMDITYIRRGSVRSLPQAG